MNKKLMLFMNTCMLRFSSVADGYFSSAQILETGLAKVGIKFPKKLWFQYKLPDGISPEKFELEMEKIWAFECGKIPTMPMSNIRITVGGNYPSRIP